MRVISYLLLLAVLTAHTVQAGTMCEPKAATAEQFASAIQAASAMHNTLQQSGASVALLGRAGADLSRYGLRYSHFGFAVRDDKRQRWLITHLLNHCGSSHSALFRQGLLNFFLDDLYTFHAWLIIPSAALQHRLAVLLQQPLAKRLHQNNYNVIAHPYRLRYQNSNQWGLELLVAAQARAGLIVDRKGAQNKLKQSGYRPDRIMLPLHQRIGARLFKANVQFDDHPLSDRIAGEFNVVTVRSVFNYIIDTDQLLLQRRGNWLM